MEDPKSSKKSNNKIHINLKRCKGCGFCIEFCPTKTLKFSDTYGEKGYRFPVVEDESKCVGCKLCEKYCPDFAIWIEKKGEAKK